MLGLNVDAISLLLWLLYDFINCVLSVLLIDRIVFGYDEGTIMVKIGREEPIASMDNGGKIIWAKHNEVQTVNIKSVGTTEV